MARLQEHLEFLPSLALDLHMGEVTGVARIVMTN